MHGRTQGASQARKYDQLPFDKTFQEINAAKEELSDPNVNWRCYNHELDVALEALHQIGCGRGTELDGFSVVFPHWRSENTVRWNETGRQPSKDAETGPGASPRCWVSDVYKYPYIRMGED